MSERPSWWKTCNNHVLGVKTCADCAANAPGWLEFRPNRKKNGRFRICLRNSQTKNKSSNSFTSSRIRRYPLSEFLFRLLQRTIPQRATFYNGQCAAKCPAATISYVVEYHFLTDKPCIASMLTRFRWCHFLPSAEQQAQSGKPFWPMHIHLLMKEITETDVVGTTIIKEKTLSDFLLKLKTPEKSRFDEKGTRSCVLKLIGVLIEDSQRGKLSAWQQTLLGMPYNENNSGFIVFVPVLVQRNEIPAPQSRESQWVHQIFCTVSSFEGVRWITPLESPIPFISRGAFISISSSEIHIWFGILINVVIRILGAPELIRAQMIFRETGGLASIPLHSLLYYAYPFTPSPFTPKFNSVLSKEERELLTCLHHHFFSNIWNLINQIWQKSDPIATENFEILVVAVACSIVGLLWSQREGLMNVYTFLGRLKRFSCQFEKLIEHQQFSKVAFVSFWFITILSQRITGSAMQRHAPFTSPIDPILERFNELIFFAFKRTNPTSQMNPSLTFQLKLAKMSELYWLPYGYNA